MKAAERLFHVLMILAGALMFAKCEHTQQAPPPIVEQPLAITESGDVFAYEIPKETWVVSYHLEKSWGASDLTGSILLATNSLSTRLADGQGPDNRLYAELEKALAQKGITVRPRKDKLFILGFSRPISRDMVIETPPASTPKQ